MELTPRTKVKATLAAIDDDSDREVCFSPSTNKQTRQCLGPISGNLQNTRSVSEKLSEGNSSEREEAEEDDDDQYDEDEEEEVIVPRGRVAARLNAQMKETPGSGSDQDGGGSETAYTRIKKRLLLDPIESQKKAADTENSQDRKAATFVSREASPMRGSQRAPPFDSTDVRQRSSFYRGQSSDSFSTNANVESSIASAESLRAEDDRSELLKAPANDSRLQELIAKKRAEREAREAEEKKSMEEKFITRRAFEKTLSQDISASDGTSDDDLAEKRLAQSARPVRKASKKALEEMNRETQRMNRNMQLAHQARTKKKISKDSLFARFNFHNATSSKKAFSEHPSSSTIPSSAAPSDIEETRAKDSPPTSPANSFDEPLGKSILTSTSHRKDGKTVSLARMILWSCRIRTYRK